MFHLCEDKFIIFLHEGSMISNVVFDEIRGMCTITEKIILSGMIENKQAVSVFDLNTGCEIFRVEGFKLASGVAADENYIYVVDRSNHRLVKFNKDGNGICATPKSPRLIKSACGLLLHEDNVLVTCNATDVVRVYNRNLYLKFSITNPKNITHFRGPTEIEFGNGQYYVANTSGMITIIVPKDQKNYTVQTVNLVLKDEKFNLSLRGICVHNNDIYVTDENHGFVLCLGEYSNRPKFQKAWKEKDDNLQMIAITRYGHAILCSCKNIGESRTYILVYSSED